MIARLSAAAKQWGLLDALLPANAVGRGLTPRMVLGSQSEIILNALARARQRRFSAASAPMEFEFQLFHQGEPYCLPMTVFAGRYGQNFYLASGVFHNDLSKKSAKKSVAISTQRPLDLGLCLCCGREATPFRNRI
jgi:hypothetical protein